MAVVVLVATAAIPDTKSMTSKAGAAHPMRAENPMSATSTLGQRCIPTRAASRLKTGSRAKFDTRLLRDTIDLETLRKSVPDPPISVSGKVREQGFWKIKPRTAQVSLFGAPPNPVP